jgi:hypothetical protein
MILLASYCCWSSVLKTEEVYSSEMSSNSLILHGVKTQKIVICAVGLPTHVICNVLCTSSSGWHTNCKFHAVSQNCSTLDVCFRQGNELASNYKTCKHHVSKTNYIHTARTRGTAAVGWFLNLFQFPAELITCGATVISLLLLGVLRPRGPISMWHQLNYEHRIWGSHRGGYEDIASCSQLQINRRFGGTRRSKL